MIAHCTTQTVLSAERPDFFVNLASSNAAIHSVCGSGDICQCHHQRQDCASMPGMDHCRRRGRVSGFMHMPANDGREKRGRHLIVLASTLERHGLFSPRRLENKPDWYLDCLEFATAALKKLRRFGCHTLRVANRQLCSLEVHVHRLPSCSESWKMRSR